MTTIETWFIPCDILTIVCITLTIILAILFLSIIILNETCHTIPMMLIANTCVSTLGFGCNTLLNMCTFVLENDLRQIQYQNSFCIVRAYFDYATIGIVYYSFVIQALYRYIIIIYPNRLFWQSAKFQFAIICSTWMIGLIYPLAFMFIGAIVYNVDNQICQLPIQPTFPMIYAISCVYLISISMIMFIYFQLVRHIRGMRKRVTPVNTLIRARRELKMVQRTVILVGILVTIGTPYASFVLMSFFTSPPKYHFRIAYIFVDISFVFMMFTLFQFTDPLKASVMKRIKRRPNRVVAAIT